MAATVGNTTERNASENTPSFSHNNNGATVVLCIQSNTSGTIAIVPTYNSVSLTLVQKISDGTRRAWMYYLDNAASGVNTMTWDMAGSGGVNMRSIVISLISTDTDGGSLGATGSDVTGSSVSVTLGSTEADSIVVAGLCKQTNNAITPGADDVEIMDGQIVGTDNRAWAGHTPGGGSVTISASWSGSVPAAFNVAEFQAAPAVGGTKRAAMFFSLAGIGIPAATLAGLYKAGAVAI